MSGMNVHLPALQIAVPMLAGPLLVLFRHRLIAWAGATLTAFFSLYASISILNHVRAEGPIHYALGGWADHVGIVYHIDVVNAYILT